MAGDFRMSAEIVFHMWRSAENTNAVSEMFSWALFFVMRVVSTHDCMTLWHSYPFFKTLADFCRINENRHHFHISRWDSRNSPWKAQGVFFSNKLLGPLDCWKSWWWIFVVDFFHQYFPPSWKGEKSSSYFFRVLGGWCMTGFHSKNKSRKSKKGISRPFSRTYLLVVEIITKEHQFKRTTWNPQSQRCINGCSNQLDDDFSSLHRKYANEEIHQTSRNPSIGKRRTDWDFRYSRTPGLQGMGRYGRSGFRCQAPPGHGDVMEVGTLARLRSGGEGFLNLDLQMGCWIDLYRWVVQLFKNDWLSHKQGEANRTFKCSGKKQIEIRVCSVLDHWMCCKNIFFDL